MALERLAKFARTTAQVFLEILGELGRIVIANLFGDRANTICTAK